MPAAHLLIFRQHRDGVLVIDTAERIVDANRSVGAMVGAEPALGAPVDSLLPFWKQIPDLQRTEGDGRVEVGHAGATFEVRSRLIRDYGGTVIGRLIVLHDVSERSRLTRELAAYARTVAHDLKNPLAGAIGFIDLVKSDEPNLDEESSRLLGEAQTACHRMVNIINELLRTKPGDVPEAEASPE
jgi:signal transduction histidine kinase